MITRAVLLAACLLGISLAQFPVGEPTQPPSEPEVATTTAEPTFPPTDPGQVRLDMLWGVFNLILAGVIGCYVSSRPQDGIDRGYVAVLVLLHSVEGTAFLVQAVNRIVQSKWLIMLFMVSEISFHTPCLWARFVYMYNCDVPKTMLDTFSHIIPFTCGTALMLTWATPLMTPRVRDFWNGIAFETPGILGIFGAIGLAYAACQMACRNRNLAGLAFLNLIVTLSVFVLHVSTMFEPVIAEMFGVERNQVAAVRMFLQAGGFALVAGISALLCENGCFNAAGQIESAWTCEEERRIPVPFMEGEGHIDGAPRRFAISSDRIFSAAFFFSILAYIATFICLRFFTPEYDRLKDPIYNMYETLHPCILLDYLPGILFAQPLYDMQLFLVNLGMQVAIIKKCLEGGFPRVAVGAVAYTVFFMSSCIFQLVFTFNPSEVSVLAHSLPFMIFQIGIGSFVYAEILSLKWNEGVGIGGLFIKYPCFMIYSFGIIFLNLGAVVFMTEMLTKHPEAALNRVDMSEVRDSPYLPETTLQKVKMGISTLFAAGQEPLYFLWFWMTPRKYLAVAFNLSLDVADPDSMFQPEDRVDPKRDCAMSFAINVDRLLKSAMTLLTVVLAIAAHVNYFKGERNGVNMDWRQSSRELPGSAIIAVGWVVVIFILLSYIILDVYATWQSDLQVPLKMFVSVTAGLLGFAAFLAHGGTIPLAAWFYPGPLLFKLAFCGYVISKTLVTCILMNRRKPVHVIVELLVALSLGCSLLLVINSNTLIAEFFCIILATLWAYMHSVHVVVKFTHFQQVEDLGNNCPWPLCWELPPCNPDLPISPNCPTPVPYGDPRSVEVAGGSAYGAYGGGSPARVVSPAGAQMRSVSPTGMQMRSFSPSNRSGSPGRFGTVAGPRPF